MGRARDLGRSRSSLRSSSCKLVGSNTNNNLRLPGTDSQRATGSADAEVPAAAERLEPGRLLLQDEQGHRQKNKQAIVTSYKTIKKLPHVYSATSPFSQQGQAQISKDKHTAFITVLLSVGSADLTDDIANSVLDAAAPGKSAGMQVAVGGPIGSELPSQHREQRRDRPRRRHDHPRLHLRNVRGDGMPILSAMVGLACGLALIALLGNVASVPSIARLSRR